MRKALLSIMLFSTTAAIFGQNLYYVNNAHPQASDSNPGTESMPWATIQHGVDSVSAGSRILVAPGAYGRTKITAAGTLSKPIIIEAQYPADPDYTANNTVSKGFVVDADNVIIRNFEITDIGNGRTEFYRGAINILFASSVTVENCYFHELECAVGFWGAVRGDGTDVTVRGNTITKVEGISINIRGENWLVENNDLSHGTDLTPSGVDVSGDADAIRFFGTGHIIRDNYIHDYLRKEASQESPPHMDAFQTFDAGGLSASYILIERNVIDNIGAQGFMSEDHLDEGNAIHHITIRNNVFANLQGYTAINNHGCDFFIFANNIVYGSGIGVRLRDDANHSTVVNNIFYDNRTRALFNEDPASEVGSTWDYNLHEPALNIPNGYVYDVHSVNGKDPLVADAMRLDFHLLPGSPAINAGVVLAEVIEDMDGITRPVGHAPDIGPYEYLDENAPQMPSGIRIIH